MVHNKKVSQWRRYVSGTLHALLIPNVDDLHAPHIGRAWLQRPFAFDANSVLPLLGRHLETIHKTEGRSESLHQVHVDSWKANRTAQYSLPSPASRGLMLGQVFPHPLHQEVGPRRWAHNAVNQQHGAHNIPGAHNAVNQQHTNHKLCPRDAMPLPMNIYLSAIRPEQGGGRG